MRGVESATLKWHSSNAQGGTASVSPYAGWEVEGVFDELKTHLHQRRRVLRSKTPNLVRQEFFAWVMAHYAVRWLMCSGAKQHDLPPRRLSFVANVQLFKREQTQSGSFPPSAVSAV